MKRLRYCLLVALAALALPGAWASASMADYVFSVTSGSVITPSWTNIWSGYTGSRGTYAGQTSTVNLPFTFKFNNTSYTQISLSSYGLIRFGTGVSSSVSNNLAANNGPSITAFWDALFIGGGAPNAGCYYAPSIRYGTSGSSPNRVFVIDYEKISREYCDNCRYGPMFMDFQVRLYEGTNRIEFFYESASATWPSCASNYWGNGSTATSASIGLSNGTTDFLSITPNGSTASASTTSANNSVNLQNTTITAGTTYQFTPCFLAYTGNVAQGGTAAMASGDVLFSTMNVERGASATYQPFSITYDGSSACATRNLTYTLSGPAAGDYQITPSGLSPISPGGAVTFNVTFTPQTIGARTATLVINDPIGGARTFTFRATGTPRVSWTPDLTQGGTAGLVNGDTLLKDIIVRRSVARDFSPMTLRNFSTNGAIPPATITYSIDSAGGVSTQYQLLTPTTVQLGPGQSHTPIIRFLGTGLGVQHARLTVNADGEIRSFPLKVISGAPGITITANGAPADPGTPVFHENYSCVGDQASVIPLVVTNPGQFPLIVTSIDIYRTDTTIRQGTPTYPLVRDAQGRPVPMTDYIISTQPGVVPIGSNPQVPMPFTLDPGQSRTLYATFVGTLPGKRFGRVYIRTNGENAFGTDTTMNAAPNAVTGLLTFDLVGRAIGSRLAASAAGISLKPIVFPDTRVGDTTVMSFTIANTGACDLRINRNRFRIYSGDVNEFTMLTSLRRATIDPVNNDIVLAPGLVDTVTVQFTPSRGGTRMATIYIQTNDSTLSMPGLSERGAYRLDLSGRGRAGLDARDLTLAPVVIGSWVSGVAVLENSQTSSVGVASISFKGGNAAEFAEDPAMAWPARPFNVLPGAKLELGVRMTPTGQAGMRATELVLVTTSGDSIRVAIRGEAGTQTLVVAPNTLFENVTIAASQTKRQMLMLSNTGTLPVRITSIALRGADSAMYRLGTLPRRDLEAGQTEYLEVTFAPTDIGQTSAEIVVTASNGQTYTVALGGTAVKIRRDHDDPTVTAPIDYGTPGRATVNGTHSPTLR